MFGSRVNPYMFFFISIEVLSIFVAKFLPKVKHILSIFSPQNFGQKLSISKPF